MLKTAIVIGVSALGMGLLHWWQSKKTPKETKSTKENAVTTYTGDDLQYSKHLFVMGMDMIGREEKIPGAAHLCNAVIVHEKPFEQLLLMNHILAKEDYEIVLKRLSITSFGMNVLKRSKCH